MNALEKLGMINSLIDNLTPRPSHNPQLAIDGDNQFRSKGATRFKKAKKANKLARKHRKSN